MPRRPTTAAKAISNAAMADPSQTMVRIDIRQASLSACNSTSGRARLQSPREYASVPRGGCTNDQAGRGVAKKLAKTLRTGSSPALSFVNRCPARVMPHRCPARACEYPECRVVELQDRMFRYDDGTWYCPRHGLIVATRALVALYRVEGEADWSVLSEVIEEALPEILRRIVWSKAVRACSRAHGLDSPPPAAWPCTRPADYGS